MEHVKEQKESTHQENYYQKKNKAEDMEKILRKSMPASTCRRIYPAQEETLHQREIMPQPELSKNEDRTE